MNALAHLAAELVHLIAEYEDSDRQDAALRGAIRTQRRRIRELENEAKNTPAALDVAAELAASRMLQQTSDMLAGQKIDRAARALGLLIRTKDPKALRRVVATFKKNKGSMTVTAKELGVSPRTLHLWCLENPELAAESQGRGWKRPSDKEIADVIAKLQRHDGKITLTAEALGISFHTLYRMIDELPEVAKHATGMVQRTPRKRKRAA